ncbi:MAG: hypothetical protein M3076_19235 [Actinomycetota bacterium]|nr:hypothetical protein [Actinomycetota bacterium]
MDDHDEESFEEKIRAIAGEVSKSVEHAAERIDLDEIAARIGMSGERVRELADLAGRWLTAQFAEPAPEAEEATRPAQHEIREPRQRLSGPHPLDVPSADQGLALSALESGRWKVNPGSDELIAVGDGPNPSEPVGLAGELRARDWIAADGELTTMGRDALKRWSQNSEPS